MTALGMIVALSAALWVGYLIGHRRGSRTPSWAQRTSPVALGRQAVGLMALVAASRLQRTARKRLPALLRHLAR